MIKKILLASLIFISPSWVLAQTYPDKPVKIVVPYTPGGATDALARSIAIQLAKKWGKPVLVDNKGGASGMIGAEAVAKATPDGYTLMISDSAPYVILPNLYPNINYSPLKDFAPITLVARQAPIIVISTKIPANNVKELIAYLKAHPDTPYASLGNGSYPHVAMEDFQKLTGTKLLHVPYKGTAQIITDLIGGQVDLYVGTLGAFEQHEKSGKIKILAAATDKRLPFKPDLPTVAESGVPGFAINVWFGMVATAGSPTTALNKIHQYIVEILKNKTFIDEVLTPQALLPGGDSRADFGALMKADTARWGEIIKTTGIKPAL